MRLVLMLWDNDMGLVLVPGIGIWIGLDAEDWDMGLVLILRIGLWDWTRCWD